MSKRRSEPEDSEPVARTHWLPMFFAILFSAIGVYVALFELSPAFEEHRAVRAALRTQLESKARLDAEITTKRKEARALQEDPQATQRELDKRGLLKTGNSAGLPERNQGTSSDGQDRGQSQR